MRFKRKEFAKLMTKRRLWIHMGWTFKGFGLNCLKQYSSLNCGKVHTCQESFKHMDKHLRNKRERFKIHLIRKDLNYEEKTTKEPR